MDSIYLGFFMGLLGSLHCLGMCGPIGITVPVVNNNLFFSKLLYNFGRIFTYAFLGLMAGLIGSRIYLSEFQNSFSIISGIILILGVFIYLNQSVFQKWRLVNKYFVFIKEKIVSVFKIKNFKSIFFIGILNGLLPCGFIYIALSGAVITGSELSGMVFMIMFGFGTLPLMMGISVYGSGIKNYFGRKINKLSPILLIVVAVILIFRGLNLGIPVISPEIKNNTNTEILICK